MSGEMNYREIQDAATAIRRAGCGTRNPVAADLVATPEAEYVQE